MCGCARRASLGRPENKGATLRCAGRCRSMCRRRRRRRCGRCRGCHAGARRPGRRAGAVRQPELALARTGVIFRSLEQAGGVRVSSPSADADARRRAPICGSISADGARARGARRRGRRALGVQGSTRACTRHTHTPRAARRPAPRRAPSGIHGHPKPHVPNPKRMLLSTAVPYP